MRVLVTGASGFIGGYLVELLQREGHEVTALVRPTSDTGHLRTVGARLQAGDVTDRASLVAACAGQDWVIHTAAVVGGYGTWEHFQRIGVQGTENLIDAAAAAGVRRLVHVSSITVYGNRPAGRVFTEDTPFDEDPEPWNHYVREKVLAEQLLWRAHRAGRIVATAVRPSVVLGPRDRNVVPRFLAIVRPPLGSLVGSGQNRVPVVEVEELCAAILRATERDVAAGRAYNLSSREPITQAEILGIVTEEAHLPPLTRRVPERVVLGFAALAEGAYRLAGRKDEPFVTRVAVALAARDYQIDCARAAAELGWQGGADCREALRRSIAWQLRGQRGMHA